MIKIASWNVNSIKVRISQVLDWLQYSQCDVLCLQELKLDNVAFPFKEFEEIGYTHNAVNGQKTYNGVAIVSRLPISDVQCNMPEYEDHQRRIITCTINEIRIICAYFVNGESVGSTKFEYKLAWMAHLENLSKFELKKYDKLALLGDFNIAPADIDVHDPIAWHEKILCSTQERDAFKRLLDLGLYDSFRLFNNEPNQYTWWDYRNFAFRRKIGLRIDHILISDKLKSLATGCEIDIEPRRNERPSDHAPIILTIKD